MQKEIIKVAMPVANGRLCLHFGHCDQFAIYEIEGQEVKSESVYTPPGHTPGAYPVWLAGMNVQEVLVGGIGQKAIDIFEQHNIKVTKGLEADSLSSLIELYTKGALQPGENACNHDDDDHEHHHNCAH